MRILFAAGIWAALFISEAYAASNGLVGALWLCTRASDRSQFAIVFYPGGGVGGGEVQNGEVSPYVFDATGMKDGQWPGHWELKADQFTWSFPDQHITITGTLSRKGRRGGSLSGTEVSNGSSSAITCSIPARSLRIGEGLSIPRDGHFIDLDGEEGVLKVPTGISLQAGPVRR